MKTYKPNEFAEMIGVSIKTLQRWDKNEKLKALRTPTGRRYYTQQHYDDYLSGNFDNKVYLDKIDINYFKKRIEELLEYYTPDNMGVDDCIEGLETLCIHISGLRDAWFIFAVESISELKKPVLEQLEEMKRLRVN